MKTKKTLLLTGGLGYIGSHAAVRFMELGYHIVIVDNLINSDTRVLKSIETLVGHAPDYYECDIRNTQQLDDIFKKYSFDGVIHFAGLKSVGESCVNTQEYFDNNIGGSLSLFKTMQGHRIKNIIFSSSATVYNHDNPIPYREDMPTGNTTNPYAHTKYSIEGLLENLSEFSDFRVLSLRYFNPIGAHMSGLLGEDPRGIPNNLLPYIMRVAIGQLPELEIFGGEYDTPDGTGVRDYIDVNDLIEGHVAAYKHLEQSQALEYYDAINLGTGQGTSVLQIHGIAEKVVGNKIPYRIGEKRLGDLGEVYCDTTKAKNILGWEATIGIQESIQNTWDFYTKKSS